MKKKLVLLMCAFCLVFGATGCQKAEESSARTETEADKEDENREKSAKDADEEVDNEKEVAEGLGDQELLMKGDISPVAFDITVPEDMKVMVTELGIVFEDADADYQMIVSTFDKTFEDIIETSDEFELVIEESGFEITQDVELTEVAEREFLYFHYYNGSDMVLVYTPADKNTSFVALAMRMEDISDEELLSDLVTFFDGEEDNGSGNREEPERDEPEGNEPDVDEFDINEYQKDVDSVDLIFDSLYDEEERTITVSVPEEMLWLDMGDDYLITDIQSFISKDEEIDVTIAVQENYGFDTMEEWLESESEWSIFDDAENMEVSDIETTKVDGKKVYYMTVSYDVESYRGEIYRMTQIFAIAEFDTDTVLWVEATEREGDRELSFDVIEEFFEITE